MQEENKKLNNDYQYLQKKISVLEKQIYQLSETNNEIKKLNIQYQRDRQLYLEKWQKASQRATSDFSIKQKNKELEQIILNKEQELQEYKFKYKEISEQYNLAKENQNILKDSLQEQICNLQYKFSLEQQEKLQISNINKQLDKQISELQTQIEDRFVILQKEILGKDNQIEEQQSHYFQLIQRMKISNQNQQEQQSLINNLTQEKYILKQKQIKDTEIIRQLKQQIRSSNFSQNHKKPNIETDSQSTETFEKYPFRNQNFIEEEQQQEGMGKNIQNLLYEQDYNLIQNCQEYERLIHYLHTENISIEIIEAIQSFVNYIERNLLFKTQEKPQKDNNIQQKLNQAQQFNQDDEKIKSHQNSFSTWSYTAQKPPQKANIHISNMEDTIRKSQKGNNLDRQVLNDQNNNNNKEFLDNQFSHKDSNDKQDLLNLSQGSIKKLITKKKPWHQRIKHSKQTPVENILNKSMNFQSINTTSEYEQENKIQDFNNDIKKNRGNIRSLSQNMDYNMPQNINKK